MTITACEIIGTIRGTFLPIDEPYVPTEPPPPFRSMAPKYDPFSPEHYLQMPVGSDLTYVSTGAAKHIALVGTVAQLNYNNWTDPYYTAVESDPACSAIEHREYLAARSADGTSQPKRWQDVTNTETMTMVGMGPLIKKYTGNLHIPTAATWQSTSNTDRKVIINFDYEVTLTTTVYASDGVTVVGTPTVTVYPAGTLQIETQKWQRISGSTAIMSTNLSKQNVVTGTGMTEGAVASGTAVIGYVRAWEMALALAGDKYAIKHGLKVGLANAMLLAGQLWPARLQDGDSSNYSGTVPYGTHMVLPPTYDIEAMQPAAPDYAKAFLYALQLWGAWVMIRAGSNNVMSFGVEPRSPILNSTQATAIKNALNAAIPYLRISAESNLTVGTGPGTFDAGTRAANVPGPWGGGTALTAGMGLSDLDNTTGLKLPINTNPATWV